MYIANNANMQISENVLQTSVLTMIQCISLQILIILYHAVSELCAVSLRTSAGRNEVRKSLTIVMLNNKQNLIKLYHVVQELEAFSLNDHGRKDRWAEGLT